MNVLIIGNGGREHALAWKAIASPHVMRVYVAPGNAGTAQENGIENVAIDSLDIPALVTFAQQHDIDLTLVGPEAPLVAGIVDRFQAAGLAIFGPTRAAAQLEGSKRFSKDFLARHNIPTAAYATFTSLPEAFNYLENHSLPVVIKADGLAAGKGVIIAETHDDAKRAVQAMLAGNAFGEAGHRVVIEAFLAGEEASFIVMVDGEHILPMATSQDHKRAFDGDNGPNTGGMGAYSPAPVVTDDLHKRILDRIIAPTVRGMAKEGHPYRGFLYAGLMIDKDGNPHVIEFNCRLGDPETQPILMRLQSDLIALCHAAVQGRLNTAHADWDPNPAIGVVMAARGYPDPYPINDTVHGVNHITDPDCKVFMAGAYLNDLNEIKTQGGRVLCVTARGSSIEAAQKRAYDNVQKIHWDNHFYRNDIGHRALNRQKVTVS